MKLSNSSINADILINQLELLPHPEGGYYKETYRSEEVVDKLVLPEYFTTNHVFSTAIYFLLKSGQVSKLHKIKQDEIWHFYFGSALKLVLLRDNGMLEEITLSPNITEGHFFQALVPANTWMAAYPLEDNSFTLVGCTVAPGFEFSDFTMGNRLELMKLFPKYEELIKKIT